MMKDSKSSRALAWTIAALQAPAALWISCVLSASDLNAQSEGQSPREIAAALRSAHAEYAEAKRTISAEREAWRKGKQTLATQIEVLTSEIAAFEARIKEAKKSIETTEAKSAELQATRAKLTRVSELLEARITKLEVRAKALLKRVPQPLADSVAVIAQRIPNDDKEREAMSLSVRYQNVIGVLNPIDKWNREVKVTSEQREQADGRAVSVTVIYIGLAQAYYVGGKGAKGEPTVAGTGVSSEEGWRWTPQNELAADIATAVAVYRSEQLARNVLLPVTIR